MMNKLIGWLFILFIGSSVNAQIFDVDTILYNGDNDKHLNIVILSDGYVVEDLDKFSIDAENISNALFDEVPYLNYQNYFNVFAIRVPSNESGANHPGTATDVSEPDHPVKIVDNYFGSSFDVANIHRLLVPLNPTAIYNTLAENFPLYDQVIILVNSPYYGGSGGQFATSSLNGSAAEIAIHEMGHSFANLIDEYYAGDQFSGEGTNMTAETDPTQVKWKNWLEFNDVGIYQHCCGGDSENWYRPHESCKMRFLGPDFCPVCIEGTIEVIHSLVPAVVGFEPDDTYIKAEDLPIIFRVELTYPIPNTLATDWSLNGENVAVSQDSLVVSSDDLKEGVNNIMVIVEDQTDLLRVDDHDGIHLDIVMWEILNDVTGIKELNSEQNQIKIELYPNPAQEYLIFNNTSDLRKTITAELFDVKGNSAANVSITKDGTTTLDIKDLIPGIYIVRFKVENQLVGSMKVVKD